MLSLLKWVCNFVLLSVFWKWLRVICRDCWIDFGNWLLESMVVFSIGYEDVYDNILLVIYYGIVYCFEFIFNLIVVFFVGKWYGVIDLLC